MFCRMLHEFWWVLGFEKLVKWTTVSLLFGLHFGSPDGAPQVCPWCLFTSCD